MSARGTALRRGLLAATLAVALACVVGAPASASSDVTGIQPASDPTGAGTFEPIGRTRLITKGDVEGGWGHALSRNARFVAYQSATELEGGEYYTNVHWLDRRTGETKIATVAVDGVQQLGVSIFGLQISGDGRYVVFDSTASNYVPDDLNGDADVFLWDAHTEIMTLVSRAEDGAQGRSDSTRPAISLDGRFIAFTGGLGLVPEDDNSWTDIFRYEIGTGELELVSARPDGLSGNSHSEDATITGDGGLVAYASRASDLVEGDADDGLNDIYVTDLDAGTTRRLTYALDGGSPNGPSHRPSMSRVGHHIAFISRATDLTSDPKPAQYDVFLMDSRTGDIRLVTHSHDGGPADHETQIAVLSRNGRFVALASDAENLVAHETHPNADIYLYDSSYDKTYLVSHGWRGDPVEGRYGAGSWYPTIGASSRYVGYGSGGGNIVRRDDRGPDFFLYRIEKVGLD